MTGTTDRFKFTTFTSTQDRLDYRAWKFSSADRILLDRLLTEAVERHRHAGTAADGPQAPPRGPALTYATTGGMIPANTAVYYRSALVDDHGQEQVASQVAGVYTPSAVATPDPPTLGSTSGSLMAGDYRYALSAYTGDPVHETPISRSAAILGPNAGGVLLKVPPLPSGATGFNVYREGATEAVLSYLATIAPSNWTDAGVTTPNALRTAPTSNTTNSTNTITITPSGSLGVGQSWKVYRSYSPTNWDDSLLAWTTASTVVDVGAATSAGAPPEASAATGSPPKVDLVAETIGTPPPRLTPTSTQITFALPGPVALGAGPWQWVNDFDQTTIISLRATLGRDSTPAAQPVQVALEWRRPTTTTWTRYQDVSAIDLTADISVGATTGSVAIPFATTGTQLAPGYAIRPVVTQTGGGATPTDVDLAVSVTVGVVHGSDTQTHSWNI